MACLNQHHTKGKISEEASRLRLAFFCARGAGDLQMTAHLPTAGRVRELSTAWSNLDWRNGLQGSLFRLNYDPRHIARFQGEFQSIDQRTAIHGT